MDTTDFTAVLKELKACGESIRWVDNRPLSAVWDSCPRDDWKKWLLRAVKHPARKVYDDAIAPALKAYDDARVPALKVYQDARPPALKAYNDAIAPALKAYDDARVPALKALLAVDVQSVQNAIDDFFKK